MRQAHLNAAMPRDLERRYVQGSYDASVTGHLCRKPNPALSASPEEVTPLKGEINTADWKARFRKKVLTSEGGLDTPRPNRRGGEVRTSAEQGKAGGWKAEPQPEGATRDQLQKDGRRKA